MAWNRQPPQYNSVEEMFNYTDPMRSVACLQGLRHLYEQGELCDITLAVGGARFPCHRVVLASASEYFRAMFTSNFMERNSPVVMMSEVEARSMKAVLEYLYKGFVAITGDSVQQLFHTSHMLQIKPLEDLCCSYMSNHITDMNCIGVYFFAATYKRPKLLTSAKVVICQHFNRITRGTEFLQLNPEHAAEILSFSGLQCPSEMDVFTAAMRWIERAPVLRRPHVHIIMKSVRFALLDEHYFRQRVKNKLLFKSSPLLAHLFDQVIYYMNHPNRWHELELLTEPRTGSCHNYRRPIVYTTLPPKDGGYRSLETFDLMMSERFAYQFSPWPPGMTNPVLATTAGCTELYCAGGTGEQAKVCYRIKDKLQFTKVSSMHSGRHLFSFVHMDRFLFAIGGMHKTSILDSVEKYNVDRNQWTKVANLPIKTRCLCAVSYRGKLYVFGGETQAKRSAKPEISNRSFCYDPETDKWSKLQSMPTPRALAGCAIHKGSVLVVGGIADRSASWIKSCSVVDSECLCTVDEYCIATNSWSVGPPLPWGLCAAGVVKYYGTVYVLGGLLSGGKPSHRVLHLTEPAQWTVIDHTLHESVYPSVHSCYVPVNLRATFPYSSDTESESTFEMRSYTRRLGGRGNRSSSDTSSSSSSDSDDSSDSLPAVIDPGPSSNRGGRGAFHARGASTSRGGRGARGGGYGGKRGVGAREPWIRDSSSSSESTGCSDSSSDNEDNVVGQMET